VIATAGHGRPAERTQGRRASARPNPIRPREPDHIGWRKSALAL